MDTTTRCELSSTRPQEVAFEDVYNTIQGNYGVEGIV